jgi:aldehyde dehydrogenase (NAD+)
LLIGGRDLGEILVDHPRVALVSATPRRRWAARWARGSPSASPAPSLELGGNNAAIVCPSADLDLTLRGVAFAAIRDRRPAVHDAAAALRP